MRFSDVLLANDSQDEPSEYLKGRRSPHSVEGRRSPQSVKSSSRPQSRAKAHHATSFGAAGAGPMRKRQYAAEIVTDSQEQEEMDDGPEPETNSEAESMIREAKRQNQANVFRAVRRFPGILTILQEEKSGSFKRRRGHGHTSDSVNLAALDVSEAIRLHQSNKGKTQAAGNIYTTGFCTGFDHSTCTVKSCNRNAKESTLETMNRVTRLRVRATQKAEISRLPPFRSNTPRPHLCDRTPSLWDTPYVDPRPLSPRGPSPALARSPSPSQKSPSPDCKKLTSDDEAHHTTHKSKEFFGQHARKTFGALRTSGIFSGAHAGSDSRKTNAPFEPERPKSPETRSTNFMSEDLFLLLPDEDETEDTPLPMSNQLSNFNAAPGFQKVTSTSEFGEQTAKARESGGEESANIEELSVSLADFAKERREVMEAMPMGKQKNDNRNTKPTVSINVSEFAQARMVQDVEAIPMGKQKNDRTSKPAFTMEIHDADEPSKSTSRLTVNTEAAEGAKDGSSSNSQLVPIIRGSFAGSRSAGSRSNSFSSSRPNSPRTQSSTSIAPGLAPPGQQLSKTPSRSNIHPPTQPLQMSSRPNSPSTSKQTSRSRKLTKAKTTKDPETPESSMPHAPGDSQKFFKKKKLGKAAGLLSSVYNLKSSVADRIKKIDQARQEKQNREIAIREAGIVTEDDLNELRDSFKRYTGNRESSRSSVVSRADGMASIVVEGEISSDDFFEALADLGLRPKARTEKQQVWSVMDQIDDGNGTIDFLEFVQIVQQVRTIMIEASRNNYFQAFLQYEDPESQGLVLTDDLPKMWASLGLKPQNEYEDGIIQLIARESDADGSGEVDYNEFEVALQKARERLFSARRSDERRIAFDNGIGRQYFEEFRHELIRQYTAFKGHMVQVHDDDDEGDDTDDSDVHHTHEPTSPASPSPPKDLKSIPQRRRTCPPGKPRLIDVDDLKQLLADVGIIPRTAAEALVMEETVEHFIEDERSGEIDFKCYLMFLKVIRERLVDCNLHQLEALFKRYDRDDSGDLSMKEVSSILLDLGLQPRSREELEEIQAMMEEADSDGSNEINFDEFCVLFQHISEKIQAMLRESERQKAMDLGFSKNQLMELRKAFEALDEDLSGGLSIAEVRKGLRLMRRQLGSLALRDVFESLDSEKTGELDFIMFLSLMRYVEDHAPKLNIPLGMLQQGMHQRRPGSPPTGGSGRTGRVDTAKKMAKPPRTTEVIANISNPEHDPMPLARSGRRQGVTVTVHG